MKTHQLTRRIQWIKGNNIYKPCTNSLSQYTKLRTQTTVFIDSPVKVIGKLIELSLHFIVLLKLPQPIVFVAICLFISRCTFFLLRRRRCRFLIQKKNILLDNIGVCIVAGNTKTGLTDAAMGKTSHSNRIESFCQFRQKPTAVFIAP